MSEKIRVGVIGCGSIAKQRHGYEYHQNQNVEIAGFFDPLRERAQGLVDLYGGQIYEKAEVMISDASIDAISVCAANKYHADLSILALDHGKHVLCEKPMATNLLQCEAMVEAAKRNGKRLLIGQNQRLSPAHAEAKRLLKSGQLGRVITFQSTFGHAGPEMWSADKSANTWFFKKDLASFGSMADLGIHKIDLILYLIDSPVKSVLSVMGTLDKTFEDGSPIEVDDNSQNILCFRNGAIGAVTTSWTHYGEENNSTVLYCENGILKLYADPEYSVIITWKNGEVDRRKIDRMQTNTDAQQESSGVIDQFIHSVRTGLPSVLDAENVFESMKVVYACLRSAETGGAVNL